ncbi:fibronectin-binding protein A [Clostridia bacterium]|nr:fibronectin-binding protein A [Clostridia bacterium]
MAFDGIVIANLVDELQQKLVGGRILKCYQPEKDELILSIKQQKLTFRLFLCANASLPLIYLTEKQKENPLTAPNFCMLLRKHIMNGKILSITQPDFERVIELEIEHVNELGDYCRMYLIMELMGKHSNLIFCNEQRIILDSIKHISAQMSSVREVLPLKPYFLVQAVKKANPLFIAKEEFLALFSTQAIQCRNFFVQNFTGISPLLAQEFCFRANIDSDRPISSLNKEEIFSLYQAFDQIREQVRQKKFTPSIWLEQNQPIEFSSVDLLSHVHLVKKTNESISCILEEYYSLRSQFTRMKQKSFDLRKIVSIAYERNRKKYELQKAQLEDTKKKEQYRLYGELIQAYQYQYPTPQKEILVENYYQNNEKILIPLDEQFSVAQNASYYFERYQKLKRTEENLKGFVQETLEELNYLESVNHSFAFASSTEDLQDIREELMESRYIRRKPQKNKRSKSSQPLHYVSPEGFSFYVGKNNVQNDYVTFQLASSLDWWFHAKGIPGSHVILKMNDTNEPPEHIFEYAAALAAYYSKAQGNEKVEIDYIQRKYVKKIKNKKPGAVLYHTNYSLIISGKIPHALKIVDF